MRHLCRIFHLLILCAGIRAGEFPIHLAENLIWVEVRIAKCERTLNFLLDTGATVSVLDAGTSQELRLRKGTPVTVAGVGASVRGYWPTRCEATAGKVELPRNYLVLSLKDLSCACGRRVDGLIGADFFAGHSVRVDFGKQVVRTDAGAAAPGDTVLPLKRGPKGALLTKVKVDGAAGWARVDTGFAGNLDWVTRESHPAAAPARISVGLAEVATPMTRKDLTLGNLRLKNVPTGVHHDEIFAGEAGLLGTGALSQFVLTLDLVAGELRLGRLPPMAE